MDAIEGDFIEDENGLIFDVKGFNHPRNKILAYLRYIPLDYFIGNMRIFLQKMENSIVDTQNSQYIIWQTEFEQFTKKINHINVLEKKAVIIKELNRIFDIRISDVRERSNGRVYLKIYHMKTRFDILSYIKPEYIFCSENYDFPMQAIPIDNIAVHYKPEEFLQDLLNDIGNKSQMTPLRYRKNLLSFIKWILHPISSDHIKDIGLSGSVMVGLNEDQSDFDLIVYGKNLSWQCRKKIGDLIKNQEPISNLGTSDTIKPYDEDTLEQLYQVRGAHSKISFENFKRYEIRKQHQCLIGNTEVFLRFLRYPRGKIQKNIGEDFYHCKHQTLGRVDLYGIIVDDSESIFTPCRYLLKIDRIEQLTMSNQFEQLKKEDITAKIHEGKIEILTWRGRYIEQAKNHEKIFLSGKLEQIQWEREGKIVIKNQIVLGNHKDDLFYPTNVEELS